MDYCFLYSGSGASMITWGIMSDLYIKASEVADRTDYTIR